MRSLEVAAIMAPHSTEMIARVSTNGVAQSEAAGNRPKHSLSIPKVPILSSRPTSRADVPAVACSAVSGSQVCTGTIGALIAKAMKKPTNSSFPMAPEKFTLARSLSRKEPPWTPTPMTANSITRPPAREYSRNFMAARPRRGPPHPAMRKYIGMRVASNMR